MIYEISEFVFYGILFALLLWIVPLLVLYPGIFYGRWGTSASPTFQFSANDQTRLEGMMISPDLPTAKYTFFFLNDRSSNMGSSLSKLNTFKDVCKANVVTMDYRGCGASYGMPSQESIVDDANVLLQKILHDQRCKETKLVFVGTGLGASVALKLIEKNAQHVHALVIDQFYPSSRDWLQQTIPQTKNVPNWIIDYLLSENNWRLDTLAGINVPVLYTRHKPKTTPIHWDDSYALFKTTKEKHIYDDDNAFVELTKDFLIRTVDAKSTENEVEDVEKERKDTESEHVNSEKESTTQPTNPPSEESR